MAIKFVTPKLPKMAAGQRYNRLLALEFVETDRGRSARWRFKCDCGKTHVTWASHARNGSAKSCGCLTLETGNKAAIGALTTHGKSKSPEFIVWCGMRRRCADAKDKRYADYGGRGIVVCDRWQMFQNFWDDMGERPSAKHSIDRIDNDGNYTPENCRWANVREQSRNRRVNRTVTLYGVKMSLVEACERTGLPYTTVNRRLNSLGWTEEMALTVGPRRRR